jgi:hypothetical protein
MNCFPSREDNASIPRKRIDHGFQFDLPTPDDKAIATFISLWETRTGKVITRDEAEPLATRIMQLVYLKNFGVHPACLPRKTDTASKE